VSALAPHAHGDSLTAHAGGHEVRPVLVTTCVEADPTVLTATTHLTKEGPHPT